LCNLNNIANTFTSKTHRPQFGPHKYCFPYRSSKYFINATLVDADAQVVFIYGFTSHHLTPPNSTKWHVLKEQA
jgi:hypothetical protein